MLKKIIESDAFEEDQLNLEHFEDQFSGPIIVPIKKFKPRSKHHTKYANELLREIQDAPNCTALLRICRKKWMTFLPGHCKKVLRRLVLLASNAENNEDFRQIRQHTELILRILKRTEPYLDNFQPKDLVSFLHTLTRLNIGYPELYMKFLKLLNHHFFSLDLASISDAAFSFAELMPSGNEYLEEYFQAVATKMQMISPEELRTKEVLHPLLNLSIAMVITGYNNQHIFKLLLKTVEKYEVLSEKQLFQLNEIQLALSIDSPEFDFFIPIHIHRLIKNMIEQHKNEPPTSSVGHLEISQILRRRNIWHINEYSIQGYSIDCAIPEKMLAIEIDNQNIHYIHSTDELLGHCQLRERILNSLGWSIIHIPITLVKLFKNNENILISIINEAVAEETKVCNFFLKAEDFISVEQPTPN